MTSVAEKKALKKLKAAQKEANEARAELAEARRNRRLTCGHCGAKHVVGKLVMTQRYWYTPPSGCTDGDHWNPGEIGYKCPKCGQEMRGLNYEGERFDPNIQELSGYCLRLEKEYKR